MKRFLTFSLIIAFSLTLVVCSFGCDNANTNAESIISQKASSECISVEWNEENSDLAEVYYKLSSEKQYKTVDNRLIRPLSASSARVDVLGLASGKYDVKIVVGSTKKQVVLKNIEVKSFDRSGYAHFGFSGGVGAYNDDGSIKSDAEIVYVSEQTKNTVSFKGYVGIAEILKNASKFSNPLCVRIIGKISTRSWNAKDASYGTDGTPCTSTDAVSQNTKLDDTARGITDLVGLSDKISIDDASYVVTGNEKQPFDYARYPIGTTLTTYDSYFNMLDVASAKNITVEGVGEDAEIFQWGFSFKKCNSIEVRNLTFSNYPEDACSFIGYRTMPSLYGNFWLHNCVFNRGVNNWDVTAPIERDKYAGDGSTDITGCHSVTVDYCVFNNCNKTGLVGSSDDDYQYNITFHHNYFNACRLRLPLGRRANMHYYNNYNYNVSGLCMDVRANAYIFSECNYFDNCNKTMKVAVGSACKSFGDRFDYCSIGGGTAVSSRTEQVENSCAYGNNFDTDSSLFYYDSVNGVSSVRYLTSSVQAKEDCLLYSGVLKTNQ